MSKGEQWRRDTWKLARKLEANGHGLRARAMYLAIWADAKMEARADG